MSIQAKLKQCSICELPSRLWKSNPPMCKNCAMIAYVNKAEKKPYKPLSQTNDGKVAKPFKIAPVSRKQAERLKEYRKKRDEFLKGKKCEYPGCEVNYNLDLHHSRGRVGELLCDVRYFKALCRTHHNFIECHPDIAKELNLIYSRLAS